MSYYVDATSGTGRTVTTMSHHEIDPHEDEAEARHFATVVAAFRCYAQRTMARIGKLEHDIESLDARFLQLLPHRKNHFSLQKQSVLCNQEFLECVVADCDHIFQNQDMNSAHQHEPVPERDIDKVRSTIKSLMREWSPQGATERAECYLPILNELERRFPDLEQRKNISVLTPGCGLGRLTWEIVSRGFISQGNEFSYFMLITSSFVMNQLGGQPLNVVQLYPFVHESTNLRQLVDQIELITVPDVDPSVLPANSNLSMVAGEFISTYESQVNSWDVVASCFFLDTAKNVLAYLECISKILKPGGLLINIGPLLYHYSDMPNEISIDLSYDELKAVMPSFGLRIVAEREHNWCHYAHNNKSLFQGRYDAVFFVAVKE